MKNIFSKIKYICAVPKSFLFCIKTLSFKDALKVPVLIGSGVKVFGCHKGSILFSEQSSMAMVRIGLWDGAGRNGYKKLTIINVDKGSSITFGKNVVIAKDSRIRVMGGGQLILGNDFKGNYGLEVMCREKITFGEDCLIAWNVTVADGDGHSLYMDGIDRNSNAPIAVGKHVWLCAHSTLLKGAAIESGSVVGFGTLCNKKYEVEHALIGGVPGKIIKTNVDWDITMRD